MAGIDLKDGLLTYYGNPAGYRGKMGIVADTIFRSAELEKWLEERGLTPRWEEGIYDRLSQGEWRGQGDTALLPGKCRIWQLTSVADSALRFVSYEQAAIRGGPRREDYAAAYDGVAADGDPESVWEQFRLRDVGEGHPLSISDVIELYDVESSRFYYVDQTQLRPISFEE